MSTNENKGLGVCILTRHPPEYRTLPSTERAEIDKKKKLLTEEWLKKEGVKRFGVYNPVWGTEYSTMEFWEFPDMDSLSQYRRQISKIESHVTFFKFLLGSKAHWIK